MNTSKAFFFNSVNSPITDIRYPGHVSSVAITTESWSFTSISLKCRHFATTGSQSLKGLLISAHMICRCRGMDSLHSCWNCHHYSNQIHYHGNTGHPLLLCKTSCGVTLLCKLIWVTKHPSKLMSFSLYSIRITSQLRECTIDNAGLRYEHSELSYYLSWAAPNYHASWVFNGTQNGTGTWEFNHLLQKIKLRGAE